MRSLLVKLHRWVGLFLALFLTVAGLTGAIIAWERELDAWINPRLFVARATPGDRPIAPLELARRLEAADPRLQVIQMPLALVPGRTLVVGVAPRLDPATGAPFTLAFDQVMLDPFTAEVRGSRDSFASALSRDNLLPFIYKLHYSLHLPDVGNVRTGRWVLGLVSIVWIVDCVVALVIAFPNRRSWSKSFSFRLGQGWAKLSFDMHRSGGVWAWALLLVMPYPPWEMVKRLHKLQSRGIATSVAVGGVVGATHYDPDFDMTAPPRVDLCVYDGDIDFMKKLDAGLVVTTDLNAKAIIVVHQVQSDFGSVTDPNGLRIASPMDCLADVLEFGLTAQAKGLALFFNKKTKSKV